MSVLDEIKEDVKNILIQTTKTNGRVQVLEDYKKETIEPVVKEFKEWKAIKEYTLKQKAFRWSLVGIFGVALLVAFWNGGKWAINMALKERDNHLIQMIGELNYKLDNMEFEVNITEQ
jgi:hypothetical protein